MDVATADTRRLPICREAAVSYPFALSKALKRTPSAADLKPAGRDVAKDMPDDRGNRSQVAERFAAIAGNNVLAAMVSEPTFRKSDLVSQTVASARKRHAGSETMRLTLRRFASLAVFGLAMAAQPALALDGTSPGMPSAALTDPSIPVPPMPIAIPSPQGAGGLPKSVAAPQASSLTALQYQAEGGHPIAQWKLGRMYANGDGVARDDLRAFDYFSRIANSHAEDSPAAPQAHVVANAFLALGRYYREGIPNSRVKPDRERAREMFSYAASYFGNPDAQYNLARMYLDSNQRDAKYAARWLGLAAQKGQLQAQVLLGQMLFNGDQLQRQAAKGLMWLTLAKDNARPDEDWVQDAYDNALKRASEDDRAMAARMLERWVQSRRD